MKYQYFDDEAKLIICFDKAPYNQMMLLLELIRSDLCQSKQLKYFIAIDGLESTLDTFIESCSSGNYHLYDNGRYNRLIKNLPTLCMLSEEWHDVVTFFEFIGSFNEGQMRLFLLNSNFYFKFDSRKNEVFAKIRDHCFVKIEVFSDGDVLEITSCSAKYNFKNIVNWLSKQNAGGK